jgi:hypothetical protein
LWASSLQFSEIIEFKEALFKRFTPPEEIVWRKAWEKIKQTGSLTAYVNEFTAILPRIPDASNQEILFRFLKV